MSNRHRNKRGQYFKSGNQWGKKCLSKLKKTKWNYGPNTCSTNGYNLTNKKECTRIIENWKKWYWKSNEGYQIQLYDQPHSFRKLWNYR